MERPIKFDPNSDDHLIYTLKMAYRHIIGDFSIGTNEVTDELRDAICNLIGDDDFCEFLNQE